MLELMSPTDLLLPSIPRVEDTRMEVVRTSLLVLPDGCIEWEYPELADTGPGSYKLGQVKPWLHHCQKPPEEGISGEKIFAYLGKGNHLRTCLGYRDALVLQELELDCFNTYFGDVTALFFWRSVAKTQFGLAVPKLFVHEGERLNVEFVPIMFIWHDKAPAARFRRDVSV